MGFDFRLLIAVEREVQRALKAKKRLCFFPYIGGKYNLLKTLAPLPQQPYHYVYVRCSSGLAIVT